MSRNTFIKWWFSWASSMKINFREKCFGCGENIRCLAADGTKIGITLKQASVIPIEKTVGVPIKTQTRRYLRTFVNDRNTPKGRRDVNDCIRDLAKHVIGKQQLDQKVIDEKIQKVKEICKEELIVDIVKELFGGIHKLEAGALANILIVLTGDASLTNTIPKKYIQSIKNAVSMIDSPPHELMRFADDFHYQTKHFFPELGDWFVITINLAKGEITRPYIKRFLSYLVAFRENLESLNVEAEKIDNEKNLEKYNPAKTGKAYYFTDHGDQIRQPRMFSIDQENKKAKNKEDENERDESNFDYKPDVKCSKNYPVVTKRGTTYLFLWFCPSHGHCLGFHIITSSEGRKDAANSLYAYLEKAPENIFYDFSCSLEEYCRNRESGFFSDTRFFHDIFHGYTHKCSTTYKSSRLLGFKGVNTSICEQFNAFLQCIKTSGKLMTQEHFTFYVEFFIHQWNVARKISFQKRASIAIAGYH